MQTLFHLKYAPVLYGKIFLDRINRQAFALTRNELVKFSYLHDQKSFLTKKTCQGKCAGVKGA